MARILAFVFVLLALAPALAQEGASLRIGVITGTVPDAPDLGALEGRVAESVGARWRREGGIFDVPVEVEVRDVAGEPDRVPEAVDALIDGGAHGLVCCAHGRASRDAAARAAEAGVVLLSPAGAGAPSAAGWHHTLEPSAETALRGIVRDAHARAWYGLGLLGPEGEAFDAAEATLEAELETAGMALVGSAAFAPDARVVTPEALWVATRQPRAVVAWGEPQATRRAVEALRRRGWEGPVYVRPDMAEQGPTGVPAGARVPVAPALLLPDLDAVPEPHAEAVLAARIAGGGRVGSHAFGVEGARLHDALLLLAGAFEGALGYGVPPGDAASFRHAVRDALVSAPTRHLASGSFDPGETRTEAATAEGWVLLEAREARFVPAE